MNSHPLWHECEIETQPTHTTLIKRGAVTLLIVIAVILSAAILSA